MSSFKPFADNSSVVTLDGMSIENGGDAIAIHGSVDIRKDQMGLKTARRLRDALADIVGTLEAVDALPDEDPAPERSTRTFDSPFGGGQ